MPAAALVPSACSLFALSSTCRPPTPPSSQIGSVFEYANQRPILDVIYPDSPLYTLILGFFAITGLPTAGFLFYKAVTSANEEADRLDKLDGY